MRPSVPVVPLLFRLLLLLTAPQVLLLVLPVVPLAPSWSAVAVPDPPASGLAAGPLAGPPAAARGTDPAGTWPLAWAGGAVLFLLFQLFNAIVALAGSPLAAARR